jgi:hypothetical protein
MPSSMLSQTVGKVAERVPGLRRVPVMRLLLLGEIVLLLRAHIERLTPAERRRLVVLIRDTRGRPNNLSEADRREFERLILKAEPKLFATSAAQKLSPFPIPGTGSKRSGEKS